MRWHYEMESNENFLNSEIRFKSIKSFDLASRYPGENSYVKSSGNQRLNFSISGKNDVTLTVHNVELSYNGEYCCEVTVKSNIVKHRQEMCTTLFVYGTIFITYITWCNKIHNKLLVVVLILFYSIDQHSDQEVVALRSLSIMYNLRNVGHLL
jgi:hypothetical protein